MIKRIASLLLLVALAVTMQAQKYASVNTEYIFANIPDYAQAQAQLNKISNDWQKELLNYAGANNERT